MSPSVIGEKISPLKCSIGIHGHFNICAFSLIFDSLTCGASLLDHTVPGLGDFRPQTSSFVLRSRILANP